MSRIGNKAIMIPDGIQITVEKNTVKIKGPQGELSVAILPAIDVSVADKTLTVARKNDGPKTRGFHGLIRALIANAITGVTQGFIKRLELKGVGYRAEVQGSNLVLNLGFSHPVNVAIPEDLKIVVEKNQIIIAGIDKQAVGQFAAAIRAIRPPEPYKGKGIRYVDEVVKLKPGKQAAKVGGTT